METCLLVIDVQQSFARRPYFSTQGLAEYLAAQNELIARAQRAAVPIVRVFHQEPPADAENPFAAGSPWIRPLEGLVDFDAVLTIHKTRHSALVGTGLDVWLVERGIRRLVVSGIRTEQCCETTARHASDLGWQVRFVTDATMTWAIPAPHGASLSASEIRRRTTAVLDGRFAQVVGVHEALHHAGHG